MPLSTAWVWHVNAGGVKGVMTKFLIWSTEREAVKNGSVIAAVHQLNNSGYVLALKLIFVTLNLLIFESLMADNTAWLSWLIKSSLIPTIWKQARCFFFFRK